MQNRRTEKRIAVSRLHLPDGRMLHNQVVIYCEGKVKCFYPLVDEEPNTSWYGGDFYIENNSFAE